MIKEFKLFELFDQSNIYDYELVSVTPGVDDGDGYDMYTYTFTAKDGTKYFARLSYFNKLADTEYWETFITLDFMDEEQYKENLDVHYEIKFKNTEKQDAVKIINTIFAMLVELQGKKDPWIISFDCTPDRYNVYIYCVKKFLWNYIHVYFKADDGKCYFYLYNQKYMKLSEDGCSVVRIDNEKIVYTGSDN